MANLKLKKRRYTLVSLLVLVLGIAIIKTTAPERKLKYWVEGASLKIEDFLGRQPSGNAYDAAMASTIELAPDSLDSLRVITAMDQHASWYEIDTAVYDTIHLLKHELYHLLVVDYHTQLLRRYLIENDITDQDQIRDEIAVFDQMIADLQYAYDEESQHSLELDAQDYWEFKIDSFFISLKADNGVKNDRFSGLSSRYPDEGEDTTYIEKMLLSEAHELTKYNIRFRDEVTYDYYIDTQIIIENYSAFLEENGYDTFSIKPVKRYGYNAWFMEGSHLEWNLKSLAYIVYREPVLYEVLVELPIESSEHYRKKQMAEAFFSSIRIESQQQFWLDYYDEHKSKHSYDAEDITVYTPSDDLITLSEIEISDRGFKYHFPVYDKENDQYLIPIHLIAHSSDEIHRFITRIENEDVQFFSHEVAASDTQMIVLNSDALTKGDLIHFGYVLARDSSKSEQVFYNTGFEFGDQINPDFEDD